MSVTNFTCILLEKQVHSAVRVSVSSKITFLRSIFAAFLVVLGPFWLYEEFDDIYPKNPVTVTKKDTSDHIYRSIYIMIWLQKFIKNGLF